MNKYSALVLAAAVAVGTFVPAFADVEPGEFTSENPGLSRIVTAPFRIVTGGVGAGIGAIGGSAQGVVKGLQESNDWAGDVHPNDEGVVDNAAPEKISRNLLYIPTVVLGSAVLIPKNVVEHSIKSAWKFGSAGCEWWDRL